MTRPITFPSIAPKQSSPLDEVEKLMDMSSPEAKKAQAQFIRDELARIGNEIDAKVRKGRK